VDTGAAQVRKDARIHVDKSPIHVDNSSAQERKCARIHVDTNTSQERNESRIHVDNTPIHVDTNTSQDRKSERIHVDTDIHVDKAGIHVDTGTKNGENLEESTKSGDGPVAPRARARARTRDNSYSSSYSSSYGDSYSDNSYSLELRQTELRQTELLAGLDTGVSNPERPPQKISRDPSVAGENETEKPERPFDLLAALCEELGAEVTTLSAADRAKQLAVAKRLLAAGATADEVRREARWLRSQSWVEGIDLFVIERHRAKWLLSGKPGSARAVPLPEPFIVTGQMREEARSLGLSDEVIDRETDAFCDYYQANGKTMIDWEAAWRHWMRRAREIQKSRPKSRQQEAEEKMAALLRIARGERP
jgi:hypothetical protein